MKILGVDPGFANFGWCIANLDGNGITPVKCGVFRTEKSNKKLKVLSPDDEFRRIGELTEMVDGAIIQNDVRMVCAEGMSSPRNAATVRMLGYAWGIIGSACQRFVIPLAQVNPKQLKKKLCGRISVTDAELHAEVFRRYPIFRGMVETFVTAATKREHAIDALGAIDACRDGQVFRTLVANLKDAA